MRSIKVISFSIVLVSIQIVQKYKNKMQMVRNEAEEKSDAQYSEHERSTGCSSPHTLGQRSKKMKNSRISSTRRHPAIRTSCVGPMGLVLKLGLVKTQGVMYCSFVYIEYEV